jgi:hypothetical protein
MLNGGALMFSPSPRCRDIYAQRRLNQALNRVYGALKGFRIKHPDSTRTARARRRDLDRYQVRVLHVYNDGALPGLPIVSHSTEPQWND